MTVVAPRAAKLDLVELNRVLRELAASVDAEVRRVAVGEWRLLEVLSSEADAAFVFPTSRRIYSTPTAGAATTTRVRVFNSGQTIVRHALGRRPKTTALLAQEQPGFVSTLDVAALSPALDPAEYVAFAATTTGLYTLAVLG